MSVKTKKKKTTPRRKDTIPYNIRLDAEKVELMRILGLSLPELVREVLDQALNERRCPVCGQRIMPTK